MQKYYEFNDTSNGQRFVDDWQKEVFYNYDDEKWMIWDGVKWAYDFTEQIKKCANETIRLFKEEIPNSFEDKDDELLIKRMYKNYDYLNSVKGKEAMLKEARYKVACRKSMFDTEDWHINTESGIIDLKTGEIHKHDPDRRFSKCCGKVDFEEPKQWIKFLNTTFEGDQEMIDFIQRALGYSITGLQREEIMFFNAGNGSNGKSTMLNTIRAAFADDYTQAIDVKTLMDMGDKKENLDEIAGLNGKRFVVASESKEGAQLNEDLIKQLTTKNTYIQARFRYGNTHSFQLKAHVWLDTNYLPYIKGQDKGIWRRIILIHYTHTIAENEKDVDMEEKLVEEYPKIRGWVIKGCVEYYKNGLQIPDKVTKLVERYKRELDLVGQFIEEECEMNEKSKIKASVLFSGYKNFEANKCIDKKFQLTATSFGTRIAEREGILKKRTGDGIYYYGISLKKR